jgi:hypothetical protein
VAGNLGGFLGGTRQLDAAAFASWIFMKVSVLPFRLETVSQC